MSSELNQIASGSLRWRLFLSGALCLVAAVAAAKPFDVNADLQTEQRYQLALEAQAGRDYRTMLVRLRQAATEGHPEAQEMLGMVLLTGQTLYGSAVKADRCEARTWMLRAAEKGSETARVQLTFLNRLRGSPAGRNVCG